MAKLPDAAALGERPTPVLARRSLSGGAGGGFDAEPSRALFQVGADLEKTAGVLLRAKEEADTLAAEDAYNKLKQKQIEITHGKNGFLNLKGADAVNRDLPAVYGTQLVQASKDISSGLGNDYQRQLFAKRAANSQLQLQEQAFQHVAQQSDVYAGQVLKGTVDTERRVVAAGGAPDVSLVRINAAIDRNAQRFGLAEEAVTAMKMEATDAVWTDKVKSLIDVDPIAAQAVFRAHETEIGPANKPVLAHALKIAVLPVQAKAISDYVLSGRNPSSLPALQRTLEIGGEQAIIKVAQDLDRERPAAPVSTRDTRAMLGSWISDAERVANSVRPNDPAFRDLVVSQVKNHVATIVAMQQGIQVQAQGVLLQAVSGGPDGRGQKPLTLDQLFAIPGAREAYTAMDPQAANGIRSIIAHNAHEAASGTPMRSHAATVKQLFDRIHLPDTDQRKITTSAQLTEFFAKGINRTDYDWLKKELDEQQSVGGRNFTTDVQRVRQSAHTMLLRSPIGSIQPELAEEAAYRFNFDLQQKIDEYRKVGKDPRSLLTPGSPDYALTPARVSSFMPNARAVISDAAKAQLPKVASDADYEKLVPGAQYVAPDGSVRTKGGR